MRAVISGATGLVGRHLAAELIRKGWKVTALVRPSSDRSALGAIGAEFAVCDLSLDAPLPDVFHGTDVVFHAAAAVRDWAPWSYFLEHTVRATERLTAAMRRAGCRRLVHFSTVGIYGKPPHGLAVPEDIVAPGPNRWNYYARSKALAEAVVRQDLDVTILRPTMLYGPGDRTLLGRIIPLLRDQRVLFLGDPKNHIPLVHAADLAAAAVAATVPQAIGATFNVTNPEPVTQERFFNTIAQLAGLSPVTRHLPYPVAYMAGYAAELLAHLTRREQAPRLTRYRVFLFGYQRAYSIEKITTTLGWTPKIRFADGIREALPHD